MGKSPGKWIKTVLFGKKSSKSSYPKGKEKVANEREVLVAARVSETDVAVAPSFSSQLDPYATERDERKLELENKETENISNDYGTSLPMCQGIDSQKSTLQDSPYDPERIKQEQAAMTVQSAFRGYLAHRAFRALKGIIRLQALIRGHLVRRQAVATLCCMMGIVKLQAHVRGLMVRHSGGGLEVQKYCKQMNLLQGSNLVLFLGVNMPARIGKLSANVFVCKLVVSSPTVMPLRLCYDAGEPNSVWNWLERWSVSCFWKPVPQPKKASEHKLPKKQVNGQTVGKDSGRPKRSVRRIPPANLDGTSVQATPEFDKPKRNLRKYSSHPADSVQENPQSELEKIKRNLRKVHNPVVENSLQSEVEFEKQSLEKVSSTTILDISEQSLNSSGEKTNKESAVTVNSSAQKMKKEMAMTVNSSDEKIREEMATVNSSVEKVKKETDLTNNSSAEKIRKEMATVNSSAEKMKEDMALTINSSAEKMEKETTITVNSSAEKMEKETTMTVNSSAEKMKKETTMTVNSSAEKMKKETTMALNGSAERMRQETTKVHSSAEKMKKETTMIVNSSAEKKKKKETTMTVNSSAEKMREETTKINSSAEKMREETTKINSSAEKLEKEMALTITSSAEEMKKETTMKVNSSAEKMRQEMTAVTSSAEKLKKEMALTVNSSAKKTNKEMAVTVNGSAEKTKKQMTVAVSRSPDIETMPGAGPLGMNETSELLHTDPAAVDSKPSIDRTVKNERTPIANVELSRKDDSVNNENQKSGRKAASPAKQDRTENGPQNSPVLPSYMAATESAKAKLRLQGSPRSGQDGGDKDNLTHRQSLPSSTNNKISSQSPRTQRLVHSGKAGSKSDRSKLSSRDGNAKATQVEWKR